ncbi:NAD-dependent epimerase/dehydratase family protein [Candidatus Pelagibacter sp.]|uniref:NAD-dependent epimerase/dehydratase family protein n=1 Tax=Candidatus Pelagibacter sp. TaxID=2024849 RepID=UPI003F85442F
MKKNILVTGAAGFIGFNLLKEISKNSDFNITILDNFSRGKKDNEFISLIKKKKNIKIKKIDLTQKFQINQNFSYIFHLAAIVGVKNVKKDIVKTFDTNLNSTLNLLNAFKSKKKKPTFIFFSTSEIYQPLLDKKKLKFPTLEKQNFIYPSSFNSRQSYYLSKFFSEIILQISDFNYIIYRPHNIYGPRMGYSHVIPELISKFKTKDKVEVFSPYHKRAFCYIDDAIKLILGTCFKKVSLNKIFNIGNMNEEIRIIDLVKKIKHLLNSKKNLKLKGNTLGSPIRRVPDTREIQKICKLKKLVNLNEGLIKTISWYEKNS